MATTKKTAAPAPETKKGPPTLGDLFDRADERWSKWRAEKKHLFPPSHKKKAPKAEEGEAAAC